MAKTTSSVLKVLLQNAKDLDNVGCTASQKPYCVIQYGHQQAKSKPCNSDGCNPVWNTAFKFDLHPAQPVPELLITIKDFDNKAILGTAKVPLGKVQEDGKVSVSVPVSMGDRWKQGELFVKLRTCEGQPSLAKGLLERALGNMRKSLPSVLEHDAEGCSSGDSDDIAGDQDSTYDGGSRQQLSKRHSERGFPDAQDGPGTDYQRTSSASGTQHPTAQAQEARGPLANSSNGPSHMSSADPRANPFVLSAVTTTGSTNGQPGRAKPGSMLDAAAVLRSYDSSPVNSTPPTSSPNRATVSDSSSRSSPVDGPATQPKAGASAADRQLVEELLDSNARMEEDMRSLTAVLQTQAMELRAAEKREAQLQAANAELVAEAESLRQLLFSDDSPAAERLASTHTRTLSASKLKRDGSNSSLAKSSSSSVKDLTSNGSFSKASSGNVAEMQVELEHLRRALAHRTEELEEVSEELDRCREQRADTARQLANAEAQVASLRSRSSFLTDEKALLQKALSQLEAAHENRFQSLVSELEASQRAVSELSITKQQLGDKLAEMMAAAARDDDSEEDMASIQGQLRRAWTKNMQLQVRLRQLEGVAPATVPADANAAAAVAAENESLQEMLINAKLQLAQSKERHLVLQRELSRSRSGK